MLRQHIQWALRRVGRLNVSVQHAAHHRRHFDQVFGERRVDAADARLPNQVAGTSDSLQTLRDTLGRLQLHHQVNTADVDAQFERRRADERRQFPRLQFLFQRAPALLIHAAVMRADGTLGADGPHAALDRRAARRQRFAAAGWNFLRFLGGQLRIESVCRPFGQAPVTGEDKRRAVLADVLQHTRDDVRPDRARLQSLEIFDGRDDAQLQVLVIMRVDDADRTRDEAARRVKHISGARRVFACLSSQEASRLVERPDRRRQADALDVVLDQAAEPFQRERQVHAAFVADQRVNFVDNHGAHAAEHLTSARAGEHQVQRFGSRD